MNRNTRLAPLLTAGATVARLVLLSVAVTLCATVGRAAPALASLGASLGLSTGPIYAVGYLRDELARRPSVWLGRTVQIYAIATHARIRYCPYPEDACVGMVPVFTAAGGEPAASLPLVWGLSDPLRARLRQLGFIRRFVPPQTPHWGQPATYRVVLRRLTGLRCRGCDAAVLLDASPVAGL